MKGAKIVLLVFALGAIALVAYFGLNYAPVEEGVEGAIGAVEKHRDQQIGEMDVILGGEEVKEEARYLYADFLEDAAEFEGLSQELASMATELENRRLNNSRLESFRTNVESRTRALEDRAVANMRSQLASVRRQLESRSESVENLESFRVELASFEKNLEGISRLDSRQMENFAVRLEGFGRALASESLPDLEANLESFNSRLDNRESRLESKMLESMREQLEQASRVMESRAVLESHRLASRQAYLQAISMEHQALENFRSNLAAFDLGTGDLEARALADRRSQLEGFSKLLQDRAFTLQNKALENMKLNLESRQLEGRRLGNLRGMAELASRGLESRAGELESRALSNFRSTVEAFSRQLGARESALEARALGHMQMEVQLMDRALANRSLNDRMLGSYREYLQNAGRALGSRSFQSGQLENARRSLESQTRVLADRMTALESRAVQ